MFKRLREKLPRRKKAYTGDGPQDPEFPPPTPPPYESVALVNSTTTTSEHTPDDQILESEPSGVLRQDSYQPSRLDVSVSSENLLLAEGSLRSSDHLCEACSQIYLLTQTIFQYTAEKNDKSLLKGIAAGCELCSMVKKYSPGYDTLKGSSVLKASFREGQLSINDDLRKILEVNKVKYLGAFVIRAFCMETGDLVLSCRKENLAFDLMNKPPPLENLGSDEAFSQYRAMLKRCNLCHPADCFEVPRQYLPSRLLDVGDDSTEPFLSINPQGAEGKYVALSYCWGKDPQTMLTRRMLDTAELTFPMATLSQTIQDAITVCRKLDFQYLWVDALCIVQDSENGADWQEQSFVMDEIYGNASLTIAAASGNSSRDGFLVPTTEVESGTFSMPFVVPNYEKYRQGQDPVWELPGSNIEVRFYPYDIDDKQPLTSRAWAFQEYAMSHRILSFQKEQPVWQCKTGKYYMDGPLNWQQYDKQLSWEESVVRYTKRTLTFDNDRLAAISGYAKHFSKQTADGDVYLAGLWWLRLQEQLLWYSSKKETHSRPSTYRAPSWSWASIDGPVEFVTPERKGNLESNIDLIAHSLSKNPLNPFGNVLVGGNFLHVAGFLKHVPLLEIPSENEPLPKHRTLRRGFGRNWTINFDILDVQQHMDRISSSLATGSNSEETPKKLYAFQTSEFTALILMPAPMSPTHPIPVYERIGIIQHWHRERWTWWDDIFTKTELLLV